MLPFVTHPSTETLVYDRHQSTPVLQQKLFRCYIYIKNIQLFLHYIDSLVSILYYSLIKTLYKIKFSAALYLYAQCHTQPCIYCENVSTLHEKPAGFERCRSKHLCKLSLHLSWLLPKGPANKDMQTRRSHLL